MLFFLVFKACKAKMVYCKNLPRACTIDKLLDFFSAYPGMENVKVRLF